MMDPNRPARKKHKQRKRTIGNLRFDSEPKTLFPLYFMVELGIYDRDAECPYMENKGFVMRCSEECDCASLLWKGENGVCGRRTPF